MHTEAVAAPYELVEIELGGRTWSLFASFRAIKRIKEQTGVDLRNPATLTAWETDHLPVMLFELLQHHEAPPSLEDIERQLDLRRVDYVAERIFRTVGVDIFGLIELATDVAAAVEKGEDPLAYARRRKGSRKGSRGRRPRS